MLTPGGEIFDTDRVMYLRAYLRQLQRATAEGYPLIGYFQWSLMDNFEWSCGYTKRFGLTHVATRRSSGRPSSVSAGISR